MGSQRNLTSGGSPNKAYGVLGLANPMQEVVGPYLPRLITTVLLPFQGKTIYDGLISGYNITFGGGIKRMRNEEYKLAKETFGIITSLADKAAPLPGKRKPKKRPRKATTAVGGQSAFRTSTPAGRCPAGSTTTATGFTTGVDHCNAPAFENRWRPGAEGPAQLAGDGMRMTEECKTRTPENFFSSIPSDLADEVFSTLYHAEGVRIERIVSRGHASPPGFWYDQNEHEWVIVLKGHAAIQFDGDSAPVELQPGAYLNIPAHARHRVVSTHPTEQTVWLAIHYGP